MGRRDTSGELLQPKRGLREGGRGPRRLRAHATCRTRRTNLSENLSERPVRVGRSHARATRAGGQKEQKQLELGPRQSPPSPESSTAPKGTRSAAGRPCGVCGRVKLLRIEVVVRKSGVVVSAEPRSAGVLVRHDPGSAHSACSVVTHRGRGDQESARWYTPGARPPRGDMAALSRRLERVPRAKALAKARICRFRDP